MKYTYTKYLILIIAMLLVLAGCKSKKNIATTAPLVDKEHRQIVDDVLKNQINYKTLQTKGSIEFRSNPASGGTKLSTTYTIIKDEAMQASVRMPILGTEAMRLVFTTDSVIIIDRMKKQYFAGGINEAKTMFQFDYNNLQALLTNGLFIPGKKEIVGNDYKQFDVTATQDVYMLQTIAKNNVIYNFAVDASDHIISTLISNPDNEVAAQWSYNDFVNDNGQVYPREMEAQLEFKGNKSSVLISFSKLDFDKEVTIDKTVSAKYKQVTIKELLGAYMKLK